MTVTDYAPATLILPPMLARHTPGFRTRRTPDHTWTLFDSTFHPYGLRFQVHMFDDATVFWNLNQGEGKGFMPTVEQLYDLADRTDELRVWLTDCTRALMWTHLWRRRIARILAKEKADAPNAGHAI